MTGEKLATSVQVPLNVPGAGGTVGLAQFVNSKERDPALMVAGLGLVGATFINKSPVSLEQTTPLARLQGEYQPLFVAALADQVGWGSYDQVQGEPRFGELGGPRTVLPITSSAA